MDRRTIRSVLVAWTVVVLAGIAPVRAEEVDVYGSFSVTPIRAPGGGTLRYEVAAIHASFPITGREYANGSELRLAAELVAGQVVRPAGDYEVALPIRFLYRSPSWQPLRARAYIEAGTGPAYFSRPFLEQSTRFNFVDFLGAGLSWRVTRLFLLDAGYRFRHVSNGGIDLPNHGINGQMAILGFRLRR